MAQEKYVTVKMIKLTRDTHLFSKNQKVWISLTTGAREFRVKGKYRSKGRYIEAWVHEEDFDKIQQVEVSRVFATRHNLMTFS